MRHFSPASFAHHARLERESGGDGEGRFNRFSVLLTLSIRISDLKPPATLFRESPPSFD